MNNISPLHNWTPLIYSQDLSNKTGNNIWLKMECYQPAGSFKIRGIGRLCQHYQHHGAKMFVSSSGGNAGLSVAYAGSMLGVPTHVFIPETSRQIYIEAIKAEGACVKVAGRVWDETDFVAQSYAKQEHGAYIPPFDHPLIWSGHATMIDEIVDAAVHPDAIISAVGGGGLASGIIAGLKNYGMTDVELIGVETEGAASFAACIAAKKHVTISHINTIATSLGAIKICENLYRAKDSVPMQSVLVNERE